MVLRFILDSFTCAVRLSDSKMCDYLASASTDSSTDAFASKILDFCVNNSLHISCAESLTGGLLADSFVNIPGASKVFLGSAVTYDIREKSKILGVDSDLLKTCGAVEPSVAKQMAFGCARLYSGAKWQYDCMDSSKDVDSADFPVIGLSTTGVAGPGPDGLKPQGLAYVGIFIPNVASKRCSSLDFDLVSLKINNIKDRVFECKCGKISNLSLSRCSTYSVDHGFTLCAQLNISGDRKDVRIGVVSALIRIFYALIFEDWIFYART